MLYEGVGGELKIRWDMRGGEKIQNNNSGGMKNEGPEKKKIEKEIGIGWKVIGFASEVSVLKLGYYCG
jgi:hypothetical protein